MKIILNRIGQTWLTSISRRFNDNLPDKQIAKANGRGANLASLMLDREFACRIYNDPARIVQCNTTCAPGFGQEDLASTATFLAEAGFGGVELAGGLHRYQPEQVNDILGNHGLPSTP